ncbi:MAG: hypothetical protein BGO70_07165 [Bacteroidetes bacterium 43-93]|nr:hypothetical protein [Bacteroidota bacterium]OJW97560.1 MAG: hypothetical protein BGO70_07165 [Bacteroidetes bacterium 43-93]
MKDIGKIRIELCKMNCRVHLVLPEIKKTGNGLEYSTCCDDFRKKLEARYHELWNEPETKPRSVR